MNLHAPAGTKSSKPTQSVRICAKSYVNNVACMSYVIIKIVRLVIQPYKEAIVWKCPKQIIEHVGIIRVPVSEKWDVEHYMWDLSIMLNIGAFK